MLVSFGLSTSLGTHAMLPKVWNTFAFGTQCPSCALRVYSVGVAFFWSGEELLLGTHLLVDNDGPFCIVFLTHFCVILLCDCGRTFSSRLEVTGTFVYLLRLSIVVARLMFVDLEYDSSSPLQIHLCVSFGQCRLTFGG